MKLLLCAKLLILSPDESDDDESDDELNKFADLTNSLDPPFVFLVVIFTGVLTDVFTCETLFFLFVLTDLGLLRPDIFLIINLAAFC